LATSHPTIAYIANNIAHGCPAPEPIYPIPIDTQSGQISGKHVYWHMFNTKIIGHGTPLAFIQLKRSTQ